MNTQIKRCGGIFAALIPLVFLAGCATTPTASHVAPARLAAVHAAAGHPVGSFLVTPSIGTALYSWQALNNHELLVYTRPNKAWLLHLTPCPRLFNSPFIALTSSMSQVDGFSNVYVFRGPVRCNVKKIQPVDVGKLNVHMVHRPGASLVSTASGGGAPGWIDASGR